MEKWLEVIRGIIARGWEVFIFGHPGLFPRLGNGAHLRNVTMDRLSFRESAAVLTTCQAFCGIDSVWVHMCHALDIPAIGLYGPFAWEIRTGKAPLTHALSGNGDCAPCHWHIHAGQPFPPGKPCSALGPKAHCVVLASITPDRIVAKIDALKS